MLFRSGRFVRPLDLVADETNRLIRLDLHQAAGTDAPAAAQAIEVLVSASSAAVRAVVPVRAAPAMADT